MTDDDKLTPETLHTTLIHAKIMLGLWSRKPLPNYRGRFLDPDEWEAFQLEIDWLIHGLDARLGSPETIEDMQSLTTAIQEFVSKIGQGEQP